MSAIKKIKKFARTSGKTILKYGFSLFPDIHITINYKPVIKKK